MFYCTILANKGDKKRKIAHKKPRFRAKMTSIEQVAAQCCKKDAKKCLERRSITWIFICKHHIFLVNLVKKGHDIRIHQSEHRQANGREPAL